MRYCTSNLAAALLALSLCGGAVAQGQAGPIAGTPVDRNVGDSGPTAVSHRQVHRGLGQFGVGSLLLDRFDNQPHEFDRFNPIVGDSRTSHRFVMQAPGVTAIMKRPDYIGPSPIGGLTFNRQIHDGAEALVFSPDTVFVLSPELLGPPKRLNNADPSLLNHPNRIQSITAGDPNAIMRDTIVTGQPRNYATKNHPAVQNDPNYVHPDIIERRRKLKAEREAEQEAEQAAREKPATRTDDAATDALAE